MEDNICMLYRWLPKEVIYHHILPFAQHSLPANLQRDIKSFSATYKCLMETYNTLLETYSIYDDYNFLNFNLSLEERFIYDIVYYSKGTKCDQSHKTLSYFCQRLVPTTSPRQFKKNAIFIWCQLKHNERENYLKYRNEIAFNSTTFWPHF